MTEYQLAALAIALFLGGMGSFALGWLSRSIVADKQIRELDAIIDGLRLVLARRERETENARVAAWWEGFQAGQAAEPGDVEKIS